MLTFERFANCLKILMIEIKALFQIIYLLTLLGFFCKSLEFLAIYAVTANQQFSKKCSTIHGVEWYVLFFPKFATKQSLMNNYCEEKNL
jgi:hypothetical protein